MDIEKFENVLHFWTSKKTTVHWEHNHRWNTHPQGSKL